MSRIDQTLRIKRVIFPFKIAEVKLREYHGASSTAGRLRLFVAKTEQNCTDSKIDQRYLWSQESTRRTGEGVPTCMSSKTAGDPSF